MGNYPHLGFKIFFGVCAYLHFQFQFGILDRQDTTIHMLEKIHNQKKLT